MLHLCYLMYQHILDHKNLLISSNKGNNDKRYPLKLVFIILKGSILP